MSQVLLTAKLRLYGLLCRRDPLRLAESEVNLLYHLANDKAVQEILEIQKNIKKKDIE